MKRPYYVHTPRNRYGESQVHSHNNVCHEIRDVHTRVVHAEIKERAEADAEAKRLNDAHEVELAYAAHI